MEELIARVENALRYSKDNIAFEKKDNIAIGNFNFNIARQVLYFEKDEKKLSYKESELLKLLYQNRNELIDRRDILNLLWGNDNFFNSRNLDVYITKLRGYLKNDPNVEILTIKGVGYRFVTE